LLQDPSQSNADNLNNVRCVASRHFWGGKGGVGKEEYLNAKIEELETNSKIKHIRDWYRGISEFRKGYQPRSNIVKDEKAACYTIQLMHYSHFKTPSLQHLKPINLLVITNRQEHQTHTDDIHMRPHTA